MAQPSPAPFSTYDAIGNREDLSNFIYMISPTDVPVMSKIARTSADATYHEWQTDSLAAAAQNTVIEGDDATTDVGTASVRRGNYCQISDKVPRVTGTQEAVNKAGRKSELAYQIMKRSKELKRDMELDICGNNARAAGDDSTARVSAGIPAWIATNESTSGTAPTGDGTDTRTNGTQRSFTETLLKAVLQSCWDEGGDPDCIVVGSFNKQQFSTFTGNATRNIGAQDKELIATVDVYESDFGSLEVVPDRFSRARDALVLETDRWALAYLRPFRIVNLAKDGDSDRKQLITEYSLEARNQAASGIVADLSTS
jgi:hypothetical protein